MNGNEILALIKDNNTGRSVRKMIICNNPKVDIINMNAYIKFAEILSICSQDNQGKQSFGVNQGPKLWYKCAKKDV